MKIGIVTFHWADNYGAVIQAYALKKYLENNNKNIVQVINYRPFIKNSRNLRKFIGRTPKETLIKWGLLYRQKIFENFRKKYLNCTRKIFYTLKDLEQIKDNYELLVTGSDQVWNPKWLSQFEDMDKVYFLSFAGNKEKRISYAASFGHSDIYNIDYTWQEKILKYLTNFDAVSVREKSGIEIIRKLSNRNDAVQTLDPTLLVDFDFYENLVPKSLVKIKPFIFSYVLHGQTDDAEYIETFLKSNLNYKIFKCDAKTTSFLKKGYVLPYPNQWLKFIKYASYVITNSYHCILFSLIFKTPFIALLLKDEYSSMNNRILDILKIVGQENKIFIRNQTDISEVLNFRTNWDEVHSVIMELKKDSINYLSKFI